MGWVLLGSKKEMFFFPIPCFGVKFIVIPLETRLRLKFRKIALKCQSKEDIQKAFRKYKLMGSINVYGDDARIHVYTFNDYFRVDYFRVDLSNPDPKIANFESIRERGEFI